MSVPLDKAAAPSGAPANQAEAAPAAKAPLPFDPFRVVDAVGRRAVVVVVVALVFGGAGGGYGLAKFRSKFTATGQLMRQDLPNTFRTTDVGEPFKPHELTSGTIISLMKSAPLLERVARLAGPPTTAHGLFKSVTVTPERNTDIIKIELATDRGETNTAALINLYGKEAVRLTQEIAAQEAADVNRFLKRELGKTDQDIARCQEDMLAFARESQLLDADKEIDANLRKLADLDLRAETMRLEFETADLRIAALERELANHNPSAAKLGREREELANLLIKFTDQNPLVIDQRARIAEMEAQLAGQTNQTNQVIEPPRSADDGVAVSLYVDLFKLKSEKVVLKAEIEKLRASRDAVQERLKGLPEKGLAYARFKARLETLNNTRTLLANRQREAQLFEDSTMGYYHFFEVKDADVDKAGRGKKIIIAGIAGAILGGAAAAGLIGLRESFDGRLKTRADARRATGLQLLAAIPDFSEANPNAVRLWALRAWARMAAVTVPDGGGGATVLGLVGSVPGEGRSWLIERLANAAGERGARVIAVTNRPPQAVDSMELDGVLQRPEATPGGVGQVRWVAFRGDWRWTAARRGLWAACLELWTADPAMVCLIEAPPAIDPDAVLFAEMLPAALWVVGAGMARGSETARQIATLRTSGVAFIGAVLNREPKLLIGGSEPL